MHIFLWLLAFVFAFRKTANELTELINARHKKVKIE